MTKCCIVTQHDVEIAGQNKNARML